MKKRFLPVSVIVAILCFTAIEGATQPFRRNPPPPPSDPVDTQRTTDVPIDGGLGLLLAAGAGYGVKRLRERKKKGVQ